LFLESFGFFYRDIDKVVSEPTNNVSGASLPVSSLMSASDRFDKISEFPLGKKVLSSTDWVCRVNTGSFCIVVDGEIIGA
jgi:hypothetical protein